MTRVSPELLKYLQGHITVSHVQGDRRQFLRELAAILTHFALADAIVHYFLQRALNSRIFRSKMARFLSLTFVL